MVNPLIKSLILLEILLKLHLKLKSQEDLVIIGIIIGVLCDETIWTHPPCKSFSHLLAHEIVDSTESGTQFLSHLDGQIDGKGDEVWTQFPFP